MEKSDWHFGLHEAETSRPVIGLDLKLTPKDPDFYCGGKSSAPAVTETLIYKRYKRLVSTQLVANIP